MKKRILAIILSLCMLVALLPMQVLADNDNSGGTVQTLTLHGGKVLALQNDFLRVSLYNDGAQGAIATVPSVDAPSTIKYS